MSTSNQFELEEVSANEVLLKELSKFLPQSFQMTVLIQAGLKYKHLAIMGCRIYSPRHPSYRYKLVVATNVCTTKLMSSLAIFWDTKSLSDNAVIEILKTLPDLDYTKPVIVRFLDENNDKKIGYILSKVAERDLDLKLPFSLHVMKWRHDAYNLKGLCPGYSISQQTPSREQVRKIFYDWTWNIFEDFSIYKNILRLLPTVTVFDQSNGACEERSNNFSNTVEGFDLDENNLVGWTLLKVAGDIGVTKIDEEHRRKGLGSEVTKTILGQLVEDGISPYVLIEQENKISIEMHKKLGFDNFCLEYPCVLTSSKVSNADAEEMIQKIIYYTNETIK